MPHSNDKKGMEKEPREGETEEEFIERKKKERFDRVVSPFLRKPLSFQQAARVRDDPGLVSADRLTFRLHAKGKPETRRRPKMGK